MSYMSIKWFKWEEGAKNNKFTLKYLLNKIHFSKYNFKKKSHGVIITDIESQGPAPIILTTQPYSKCNLPE